MAKLSRSYVHGGSAKPLIGQTLGEYLRRRRAALGRLRCPDRAPAECALDLSRAAAKGRRLRGRAAGARAAARRPHRHLVAEQFRMGDHAVRDRQGRADPRQHQSCLPPGRAGICAEQGRLQGADHRHGASRAATTSPCSTNWRRSWRAAGPASCVPPGCRTCARSSGIGGDRRRACSPSTMCPRWRTDAERQRLRGDRRRAAVRRSHQHPVHQRHHRLPEGRDADPSQHPQQRLLHRRDDAAHRAGPHLHSRAALSLLRHGAGQSRLRHPWRGDGLSRRGVRSAGGAGRRCRRSAAPASMACRPCSSPSWTMPSSSASIFPRCAPASWRARPVPSRS